MFNGVKVLSFTHFLQGPAAVQMLADLGADVIKIEPPKGAFERHWAGFDSFIEGVSVFFMLGNRNQRSLSIDLRTDALEVPEPLHAVAAALGADPLQFVLGGGDDHALLATFPPDATLPEGWRVIGEVHQGEGVTVDGAPYDGPAGWSHF